MSTFAAAALRRARIPTLSNEGGTMLDLDLGRSGTTNRYETDRSIRLSLEDKSSDPVLTAFEMLVRPSKPWLGALLNEDERRELGEIALDRYAESLSVSAADYADMVEGFSDPFSFEWHPGCRTPSPFGCQT